jgi:hypothetical protein
MLDDERLLCELAVFALAGGRQREADGELGRLLGSRRSQEDPVAVLEGMVRADLLAVDICPRRAIEVGENEAARVPDHLRMGQVHVLEVQAEAALLGGTHGLRGSGANHQGLPVEGSSRDRECRRRRVLGVFSGHGRSIVR